MTFSEFRSYFKEQLSDHYTASETDELFYIFAAEILRKERFELRRAEIPEFDVNAQARFHNCLLQLTQGKPYQQILGKTEFYGMQFMVNEHVLIPRPETEELLELAIGKIQNSAFSNQKFSVLDIGTGSGIIPVVLKKKFPQAEITAIDFSEKALEVAKRNAELHQTEIRFLQQDYLNTVPDLNYDIIISNPPYIGTDEEHEIADSVKEFEPKAALFSPTSDPLIFYRKIAKDANKHLTENGLIFLEINQKLGRETLELFQKFTVSQLIQDLSGNDRFIFAAR